MSANVNWRAARPLAPVMPDVYGYARRTFAPAMLPSFWLPFRDLGNGRVDIAPAIGNVAGTFTRATTATTVDSTGTIVSVASGVPRSYYDPSTLAYLGYLAEGQRTNVLLNSKLDGTNLSTQSVSVTAQAYTLSFYGTGSIVLSGTASAILNGTGAYPNRATLTFTPTAGTLTLTVSGTVQFAQLEAGSFASSFIPTAGTAVTRNADVLTYPTTGWLNASAGTMLAIAKLPAWDASADNPSLFQIGTDGNNRINTLLSTSGAAILFVNSGGVVQANVITANAVSQGATTKVATAWSANDFNVSLNGGSVANDPSGSIPACTTAYVAAPTLGGSQAFGPISEIAYYPRRLSNGVLQALTA